MIENLTSIASLNGATSWITAGVILVAGALIVTLVRRRSLVLAFFRRRTETGDAVLAPFAVRQYLGTIIPLFYLTVLYVAVATLSLPPGWRRGIDLVFIAALMLAFFRIAVAVVVFAIERHIDAREAAREGSGRSVRALVPVVQCALWVVGAVFLIENFGFHVEAIVAGLGIGGIAVALAAQSVLKDVFGYVAIVLDRPFEIGDVIQTDTFIGTVEYIGLKTTHVRSLGGELLIFGNSDLTSSRIRNWKRMTERRATFTLAVAPGTPVATLAAIPGLLREAIEAQPDTRFDRAHFASFTDGNPSFESVYFVLSPEYGIYMDRQQAINLAVAGEFAERGIALALTGALIPASRASQGAGGQGPIGRPNA
jgi:small-conductance mechanosensitive channel